MKGELAAIAGSLTESDQGFRTSVVTHQRRNIACYIPPVERSFAAKEAVKRIPCEARIKNQNRWDNLRMTSKLILGPILRYAGTRNSAILASRDRIFHTVKRPESQDPGQVAYRRPIYLAAAPDMKFLIEGAFASVYTPGRGPQTSLPKLVIPTWMNSPEPVRSNIGPPLSPVQVSLSSPPAATIRLRENSLG